MRVVREQEVNIDGKVIQEFLVNEMSKKELAEKREGVEIKSKARKVRLILSFIALFLCAVLWFFNFRWYIVIIPMILHLTLAFYAFAKQFYTDRNNVRAWNAYVTKYGDANGNIPDHVKMIHRKLIAQGKSIKC